MLNDDNYSDKKESIFFTFRCMDLDFAFRVDRPLFPIDSIMPQENEGYKRWD